MNQNLYLQTDIEEICDRLATEAQILSGKTILLTGSCGFLGIYFSAFFDQLNRKVLSRSSRVLAFDNFISSSISAKTFESFESIKLSNHDVTQSLKIDEQIDYIIHLAGIASPVWYRTHPLETLDVSVTGTRNMLELARSCHASFLHFSSSEIYGDPDPRHVPTAESYYGHLSCRGQRACYDEGKRVGETLCDIYHDHYAVRTISVRPFNVYWPGMREHDYRVLPSFASRLKAGLPLQIYGTGKQTRTFCYVTDAIVGAMLVLLKGVSGEAYNIGNPKPEISMRDLAKLVCEIYGSKAQYKVQDYPAGYPNNEPLRRCPELTKALLHLDYRPTVSLDDGIRRFLDWTKVTYVGEEDSSAEILRKSRSGKNRSSA